MSEQNLIIDGIKWHVTGRQVQPLCPKHHLRLYVVGGSEYISSSLSCEECNTPYRLPRYVYSEKIYILDKLDSKIFKDMKFINLDDEAIPIAESKVSSKDNRYFTTALLTESKVGLRLVVYAGEKGKLHKTQIFVEPDIKRLAFDQKDLHPSDVFVKLEGTFEDGTKSSINKQ